MSSFLSHSTHTDRIAAIADFIGRDFLRLAKELQQLRDTKPNLFDEVITCTGISQNKAHMLERLAYIFTELAIPEQQLNRIGWSKINQLNKVIDKSNAAMLLKLAEETTFDMLNSILSNGEPFDGKRVMLLNLAQTEHELLSKALQEYGAIPTSDNGLSNKEAAFMHILNKLQTTKSP